MNIRTQVSMHFVETTKIGTKEEEYSSRINWMHLMSSSCESFLLVAFKFSDVW
jgi:hypothetical protein